MFLTTIFNSIIIFVTRLVITFKNYLNNHKIVNNIFNNVNNEINNQKNNVDVIVSEKVNEINILCFVNMNTSDNVVFEIDFCCIVERIVFKNLLID